ncbi:GMC family oxidoreductase [Pseudomonas sp. C32]|jgi:choline dehydrogenase|uniref:GMC family oxidoreductase n=1 Tax=Pseudomonas sp. C32 TaxID=1529208 RepID=UPI002631CD6F|nr:GMC family oxidoreductase N-terminal domain-containing protein [Pseudomonas sp. C32]MDN4546988.1 GMC family oxidoreductase N-terminal domain-containing protein [Pseudomonas sp. C32]
MSLDKKTLATILRDYSEGNLDRREFMKRVGMLGVSAAIAGSLSTIYMNNVFASSTKEVEAVETGYDYIIVGSGSAGSALAHRLATTTDARILVLEAGGTDDVPEIHDPRLWAQSLGTRAAKWFSTTKQVHTANRTHSWPRGNVIGGTSCLNAMIYARGHHSDFDGWAKDGCVGWDYQSVLAHYKALEDYEGGASQYRGVGGPLSVTRPQPNLRHPGGQMFIDASKALGYSETEDFNGAQMEGPSWVNFTIKDQRRQSTGVAFLKPAMVRKNLTVLTDAPVTRVVVENGKCVGVEYLHAGTPRLVRADMEVVLAAGAIDTPRLLMLSGIGRGADLKSVGINPIHELAGVGQNLQDHVLGGGPNYESSQPLPESNYNASEVYMWAKSENHLPRPDMITLYLNVPFSTPALPTKGLKNGWCVLSGLARPSSTGTIRLKSNRFTDSPIIDPNYLATEHDRRIFSKATELARETAMQKAFDAVRAKEWLPGPGVKTGSAEWDQFLAKSANTFFHPSSTCKMGVDAMSVVDPKLRVYGISGLRIADASVMPSITTGNTNAPSIMIGWKCAEMIRGVA